MVRTTEALGSSPEMGASHWALREEDGEGRAGWGESSPRPHMWVQPPGRRLDGPYGGDGRRRGTGEPVGGGRGGAQAGRLQRALSGAHVASGLWN